MEKSAAPRAVSALVPVSAPNKVLLNLFLNISFLLLVFFYLSSGISSSGAPPPRHNNGIIKNSSDATRGCDESFKDKCTCSLACEAADQCLPQGYINYLYIFYCVCGNHPAVGYAMLLLWLLVLFYLLGNTAALYFCSNLEGLSKLLRLSPTIAGVTLLSLGNGAPDALSTIVSFAGTGTTAVGLNSVLGGTFFVSSVVLGIISICLDPRDIAVDKSSFMRDICFLLFALSAVLAILVAGKITIWGAAAFASLYLVYVLVVSVTHGCKIEGDVDEETGVLTDTSPSSELQNVIDTKFGGDQEAALVESPLLCYYNIEEAKNNEYSRKSSVRSKIWRLVQMLELPLSLPRRLTIPDVCKERWCKPFAVISVTLAPLVLAALWNSKSKKRRYHPNQTVIVYLLGGLVGLGLGLAALTRTKKERPPRRFLLPWLAGGFVMSVTWAYIVAQELLSLLLAIGLVLGIDSSVLGLTVLAWGNSLGDLMANVAVAVHDRPGGAQVAVSGCYGGPVFNILVGLGLSLVLSCWAVYPEPLVVPREAGLYQTLGFVVGGLMWALVMLPRRGMRVDAALGYGLLSIYLCFLSLSILHSFGLVGLQ